MSQDLDSEMRRVKQHLDAAADYARRAKNDADSKDHDGASSNIRKAAAEIDTALTLVRRIRRDLD
jgi:hypothetical protein